MIDANGQDSVASGLSSFQKRDWPGAVRHLTDALRTSTDGRDTCLATYYLAIAQMKMGHPDEAIADFEAALQMSGIDALLVDNGDLRLSSLPFVDASWALRAEQIELSEGAPAAREFLLERLGWLARLPSTPIWDSHLKLGALGGSLGDLVGARLEFEKVLTSETPASNDEQLVASRRKSIALAEKNLALMARSEPASATTARTPSAGQTNSSHWLLIGIGVLLWIFGGFTAFRYLGMVLVAAGVFVRSRRLRN